MTGVFILMQRCCCVRTALGVGAPDGAAARAGCTTFAHNFLNRQSGPDRYFVLEQRQLHVYDDKSRMHAGPKATIALTGCVVRVSSLDTYEFVLTTPNDVSTRRRAGQALLALRGHTSKWMRVVTPALGLGSSSHVFTLNRCARRCPGFLCARVCAMLLCPLSASGCKNKTASSSSCFELGPRTR